MRQQHEAARLAVTRGHYQPSLLQKLADRRLRNAFLLLTRYLPRQRASVPTCESAFHNAARDEAPITPKGQDLRDVLKAVMSAAVETNDRDVIESTRLEIERYLAILAEQVWAVIPGFDAAAFAAATIEATRDVADFEAAAAAAGTTRDPSAIETAVRTGNRATHAIEQFADAANHLLHQSA